MKAQQNRTYFIIFEKKNRPTNYSAGATVTYVTDYECSSLSAMVCAGCSLSLLDLGRLFEKEDDLKPFLASHNLIRLTFTCPTCNSKVPLKNNRFRCDKVVSVQGRTLYRLSICGILSTLSRVSSSSCRFISSSWV